MIERMCAVSGRARLNGVPCLLAVALMSSVSVAQSHLDDSAGILDIGLSEDYSFYPLTEPGQDDSRRIRFILRSNGEYQFGTSIDRAGDFSVVRAGTGLGFSVPVADRFNIAIGTSFGYARYDFDRAEVFDGEKPWEHIFTGQASVITNYALDDTWNLFGGGIVGFAGEDGAGFSDSVTGGGLFGAGYRHSDHLTVQLGVSVISQIEDDVAVMPVVLVDWKIDEQWRLRLGSLDTASGDLVGAGLNYTISERWSVGGRLSWLRSRFRLDDSGFAPDGVGQDDRFKGTVVLNWRAGDNIDVGVLGGMVFGGKLRIEDENGDRLFNEDYDPTPLAGVRLTLRF